MLFVGVGYAALPKDINPMLASSIFVVGRLLDCAITLALLDHNFVEQNPLLGCHPSRKKIIAHQVLSILVGVYFSVTVQAMAMPLMLISVYPVLWNGLIVSLEKCVRNRSADG